MSPRAVLQLSAAFLVAAAIFNLGYHSAPGASMDGRSTDVKIDPAMHIMAAHADSQQLMHANNAPHPATRLTHRDPSFDRETHGGIAPQLTSKGPCVGLTNFRESIPVPELLMQGNCEI